MVYNPNFKERLKIGLEKQDKISIEVFKKLGIPLINFASAKYQGNFGENIQGIEIKFINTLPEAFRIEYERRKDEESEWIPSGINKSDRSYMMFLGNDSEAHLFFIKHLKAFIKDPKNKNLLNPGSSPTGKWYTVKKKDIIHLCGKSIFY